MRLESVRMVTAWLKDDTYGVAAKLAALTLDGSDTRPATIADTSIVDETDNANAAFRRFDGLTMPALIVTTAGDTQHADSEIAQMQGGAHGFVTIQVRYCTRILDGAAAIASGTYMNRAVIASLREFHKNANVANRTRNNVRLISCEELIEQGIYEEVEDTWLLSAVQAKYQVHDLLPYGA